MKLFLLIMVLCVLGIVCVFAFLCLSESLKKKVPKDKRITIFLDNGKEVSFVGHRLPQTKNWHCYETVDGETHHFRKDRMVRVTEDPWNV